MWKIIRNKSFNFNALFNTLRMWKNESLKTLVPSFGSHLINVTYSLEMTSYNFTIHKCLCDHDNSRRVCTIYSTVIKKREKKYQQQRVIPTSYRNWTSIKLAQYLKNVSITENVKGQLKKKYILPGYAPDRICWLLHCFKAYFHHVCILCKTID